MGQGLRVVVMASSGERVDYLDQLLWTYDDASFLAHGTAKEGNAARQPVWLTASDENPNKATVLFLTDGMESAKLSEYERCCDLFDGNDPVAVEAARARWRAGKAAGHALTYWEQTGTGWAKRA